MKHVLPVSWTEAGGCGRVGGIALTELAGRFGTPLVVVDESHVEDRLARFRAAFGAEAGLTYAGKAFLCGALVRLLAREGWLVDVVSGGELELVRRAGFPMRHVILHGNAKSAAELERAIEYRVGRIVLDHPDEVDDLRKAAAAVGSDHRPELLLRLNVDLTPETHEKVRTVGPGTHFGMAPPVAASVARRIAGSRGWRLTGIHIHAGSQIRDPALFSRIAEAAVDFVAPLRRCFPETVDLDLGGGLAAPYRAGEDVPSPWEYAEALKAGLDRSDAEARLGAYRLIVEPGRSVIANAGLTLYTIHARKRLDEAGEAVAVDGGLSDNPRPSLYGASYEVLNASRPRGEARRKFRVVGRHCESGDVIATAATLPGDTAVGDVLAIPGTGAYVFAMSSRYNGVGRPAVVFVRDGAAREVVRRETDDDLLACDLALAGPEPARGAQQSVAEPRVSAAAVRPSRAR
ncbi:MAG: diaminopimelate decarboxylase [Gemmatimonadetes bacterium]|nr:diaminopimelate decarboxylase [Candidatus Palauibacter australiensis]